MTSTDTCGQTGNCTRNLFGIYLVFFIYISCFCFDFGEGGGLISYFTFVLRKLLNFSYGSPYQLEAETGARGLSFLWVGGSCFIKCKQWCNSQKVNMVQVDSAWSWPLRTSVNDSFRGAVVSNLSLNFNSLVCPASVPQVC